MSKKLYEQNAYTKEFTAKVLTCEPCKEGFRVTLDQTAFFPEGGGQEADEGLLNQVQVTDVQWENNQIFHYVSEPFSLGERVLGKINWDLRFDRMQNHTGEHLLSGVIHAAFGYNNIGFHMNHRVITLDTDGVLTSEQIAQVEETANRAIYENRKVTATFPEEEQLQSLDYRSKLDLTQGVRIVEIEGYDLCACCAPHVATTGEIGIIKVIDFYPNKQGTRIEMVCGFRALQDYRNLHNANKEIMGMLSAKREETPQKVKQEMESAAALRGQVKDLSQKLAWAQLEPIGMGDNVYGFSPDVSYDDLRYCINRLQEQYRGVCALFSQTGPGECIYILSSGGQSIQELVKQMNSTLNGRGGGKPTYAQGKVAASQEEITSFLQQVFGAC